MKLSVYAKQIGVTYHAAYKMFKRGELDAYQLPSGTIIVRQSEPESTMGQITLYARVSSHGQKEDLERQLTRLRDFAAARGQVVDQEVKEIASGMNDGRPKFNKLLGDKSVRVILVEHKDRATRFGFNQLKTTLQAYGRDIQVINQSDTKDELVEDFVAIITSMCARIYGKRQSKNRVDKIKAILQDEEAA